MILLLTFELSGCYDSASVQYNENLKIAEVKLQTSDNPLCNRFQNEVQVAISFHDEYLPLLFIQDEFNYSTFSEIVMKNVSIGNADPLIKEMPKYAYLNISNIAFWTTVRISEISKQSSQMDQCFEQQGSKFAMTRAQFTITLNLTTACFNEVVQNALSYQYSFNNKAGTVNIILQRNDPINYNCWVEEIDGDNFFNCYNKDDYIDDIVQAFISPVFQFYVMVGDRIFTTEIRVQKVLVGKVQNFFESIVAQLYKDQFYIKYVFTKNSTTMQTWLNSIKGATRVIYRLSIKTPDQDISYEFILNSFKTSQSYLILQCLNKQSCLDELSYISQISENSRFQLDCLAFKEDYLLGSIGQEFTSRLSCFQRTVVQIYSPQKVCFELEKSPYFDSAAHCKKLTDGEEVYIQAQSIQTEQDYAVEFSMQEQQKFLFQNPVFCFNCPNCVDEISNMRISSNIIILGGRFDDVEFTALGSQIQEMKYTVVVVVACVSGSIFIIYLIYDSVVKLMLFMKLTKKYKQKK